MGTITFDGTNLFNFGAIVGSGNSFGAPERDVDSEPIPGRNGDLIIDNGRYKNRRATYNAFIYRNAAANVAALRSFLASRGAGYYKLTDSYDAGHFVMARYNGPVDVSMRNLNRVAELNLTFDCKPQRFLTSGDVFTEYSSASFTVENPTAFDSKPIVRLYGTGYVEFANGAKITVNTASGNYIEFDCETLNAVDSNGTNANSKVTALGVPALTSGENAMSKTLTKVKIKPRWWEL